MQMDLRRVLMYLKLQVRSSGSLEFLMIIWLVGTIIFTIRFLEKYRAIRKDILNADPCGDEIQSMVKKHIKKLGVHKEIQVVILEKSRRTNVIWGFETKNHSVKNL